MVTNLFSLDPWSCLEKHRGYVYRVEKVMNTAWIADVPGLDPVRLKYDTYPDRTEARLRCHAVIDRHLKYRKG